VDWRYKGQLGLISNKTTICDIENEWNTWCVRIDVEIDYDKKIEIKGHSVSFGLFANFYRELERKYGKLYLALTSSESIAFLSKHFPLLVEHPAERATGLHELTLRIKLNDSRSKLNDLRNERIISPNSKVRRGPPQTNFLESLNAEIKETPGNIQARLSRAELLYEAKLYKEALEDYQYVNQKYPTNIEAQEGLSKLKFYLCPDIQFELFPGKTISKN
jgi:hypothetical protein